MHISEKYIFMTLKIAIYHKKELLNVFLINCVLFLNVYIEQNNRKNI